MRTFTEISRWTWLLAFLIALTLADSGSARCVGNVFNNAAGNVFGNVFDDFDNNQIFGGLNQAPIFTGNGQLENIFNNQIGNFGNFGNFNNGDIGNFGNFGGVDGNFGNGLFAGQFGNSLFNNVGTVLLRDRFGNPIQVVGDGFGRILDNAGRRIRFSRTGSGTPIDRFGNILGVDFDNRGQAILVGINRFGQVVNRPRVGGRFIRVQATRAFNNFGNFGGIGSGAGAGLSPIAAFNDPNDPSQQLQPRNPGRFGFVDDEEAGQFVDPRNSETH